MRKNLSFHFGEGGVFLDKRLHFFCLFVMIKAKKIKGDTYDILRYYARGISF